MAEAPPFRFPRWLLFVLIGLFVLCLVAAGVGGYMYVAKKGPFAQPEPTPTTAPTETPPASPVSPSPEPVQPAAVAVGMELSATELKVADILTLTVTITNISDQPWSEVEYRLVGEWTPALKLQGEPSITQAEELAPNQSRTVTFSFQADQKGTAYVWVLVLAKVSGLPPRWEIFRTDQGEIRVSPQ